MKNSLISISLLLFVFFMAGCSTTTVTLPPDTIAQIGAEINQFFADLGSAMESNDVEQVIPFYTLPFDFTDPEGTSITITTTETLSTVILETFMTGTIQEDTFQNLQITVVDEENVVVTVDEVWVQEYEGSVYGGTDHLRVTLVKIEGSWKIRKTELLGWD
ncbi:MAG: hypothetical protein N2Z84_05505 [Atribacterota bacterium]|nr:hypothetical protein [Atribacterota bacterium]